MIAVSYALCPKKLIIKDRELKTGKIREKKEEEQQKKVVI